MTKFQKQMLTIAAAGALTAVTALPAMAFENEFHGLFNFNTVFSNYNNGGSGNFMDPNKPSTMLKDKNKMNNYFEQRVRLAYTAKASDDLKLVTQFEINNRWGRVSTIVDAQGNAIDTGGNDLDVDGLNLVTKHAYLDFNIGKSFNTKIGIMPYKDTIKGLFIDADLPAIYTTTKLGAYSLGLGFSRFEDTSSDTKANVTTRLGDLDKDLFLMDNTFAINKDTKVAMSYYFLADYATKDARKMVHTLGLSGETKFGGLGLSGFAAMQAGNSRTALGARSSYHGWAANMAATVKAGPGTARTGFLFASGNNGAAGHDHAWVTTIGSYNESGLMILTRNTANSPTSTDAYIRRNISNQAVAFLGYGANLTDKVSLDGVVGMSWAPSSADAPTDLKINKRNAGDYMGTEISMTAGYQLYKNLKLQALAGYMINGGYYKNSITKTNGQVGDPENPYTMRLQARYAF